MLVFARKPGQRSIIRTKAGEEIVVEVLEASHGRVRLGFVADAKVSIHREEIQERIDQAREP